MELTLLKDDVCTIELPKNHFDACLTDPPYGIGFLNNEWDHLVDPINFHQAWSANIYAALKPGAHLLTFAGDRTHDEVMQGLRRAGYEIRTTLTWNYGTGMPKGLDAFRATNQDQWKGYSTALKPAQEFIVLARKPFKGTLKDNLLKYGTGALNVGDTRIFRQPSDKSGWSKTGSSASTNTALSGNNYAREAKPDNAGRYPANVLFDQEAADYLDSITKPTRSQPIKEHTSKGRVLNLTKRTAGGYTDHGGVSRMFWCAKASTTERGETNDHSCVKPIKLTEYLALLILPPTQNTNLLVPFSGSGSEIIGAKKAGWQKITGIELDERYISITKERLGLTNEGTSNE